MKFSLLLSLLFILIFDISLANQRCESFYKKNTTFIEIENVSRDKIDFISNSFQQIIKLFGENKMLIIPDVVNVKGINSFLGDRYEGGSSTLFTSLSRVPPQLSEQTILLHELTHIIFDQNILVKVGNSYFNPKIAIGKIQIEQEALAKQLGPILEAIEDAKYSDNQELITSLKIEIDKIRTNIRQLDLNINPLKPYAKLFGIYSELFSDVAATLIVKDPLAVPQASYIVPTELPSGHKYLSRAFESDLTVEEWKALFHDHDLSKAGHSGLDFVRVHIGNEYIFSKNPIKPETLLTALMLATKQQYNSIIQRHEDNLSELNSENVFEINADFCKILDELIKKTKEPISSK